MTPPHPVAPVPAVDRVAAWLRAHRIVVDAVVAAIAALPSLQLARTGLDVVLAVVACAALVARRVRPVTVGLVVAGVGVAAILTNSTPGIVVVAVLVTGYSLAAYGPLWSGVAAAVVSVAGAGLMLLVMTLRIGPAAPLAVRSVLVAAAVLAVTVWLGGALRRAGRRNVEHLRERARLLEAEQATQERLARMAERARIAREMHDIVAHSLSVIIVQADGGRVAAANDGFGPGTSPASMFGDIADTGRCALADIRALLGLLHEDDREETGDGPGAPQPGIDAIPALVEEQRRIGTQVRLVVTGEPRPLPAGTALTAYRAVQEALTNTLKHAGRGARAVVELTWHADHLAIAVVDEGSVRPPGRPPVAGSLGGHGLRGMRERVGAHGGFVDTGPEGNGFAVRLRLPYAAPPTPSPERPLIVPRAIT
jgi:signal transduction histidine kinase